MLGASCFLTVHKLYKQLLAFAEESKIEALRSRAHRSETSGGNLSKHFPLLHEKVARLGEALHME
jgi:hypothetical protein